MPSIERPSKPTRQYLILCVLFAWALVAELAISGWIIYSAATAAHHAAAPFTNRSQTIQILHLSPGYEHSGLQPADEILALNGEPIRGAEQLENILFNVRPGETLAVTVRRSGHGEPQIQTISFRLHAGSTDVLSWIFLLGVMVLFPLSCVLLGFYIAFARPADPLAWITLGMLASFGQLVGVAGYWVVWSPWREIFFTYHSLLSDLWPAWMVLFAFFFPIPFTFIRKHRWLNWVVGSPLLALCAFEVYLS